MKNWLIIVGMLLGVQGYSQGTSMSLVSSLIQTESVTGTVSDANDAEEKLVFASVSIKELDLQVETDLEGVFSFELSPGNYALEVTFIGYEAQELLLTVVSGTTTQEKVFLQPLKIQSAQIIEPIESLYY